MRTHPLTAIADKISPAETYTYADLAKLAGVSPTTVGKWGRGGWLGHGERDECGTGAPWRYSGQTLLQALTTSRRPEIPHQPLAPATSYGYGCRHEHEGTTCDCLATHNRLSRQRNRRQAEQRFPAEQQERFLRELRAGTPLPEAATLAGTTTRAVAKLALRDEDFRARYLRAREGLCLKNGPRRDDALTAPCGGEGAHRYGCRGRACYEKHQQSYRRPPGPSRGLARATERATEAGYPDLPSYLAAYPDLSGPALAARLGVAKHSIHRWRTSLTAPAPDTPA
ncbi:hypothetical protein RM574_25540 [Streptomyces sp. DSM 41982]|uniref:MerR family transcriptional regulator n=1 Tax=Streptomyces evansiae TaxID=3075535 RepID=A0ABD5EBU3_9ACTN|nr:MULTISPECIES: hypothetical protein [unclassified Streptomyces]MDT0418848.1 hypothetical protein [Streptomyces sp. DSM 41982]SCD62503.1 hypothetical protein GA0115246_1038922 [Streptomyces sp. SolWspMP-sol7th]